MRRFFIGFLAMHGWSKREVFSFSPRSVARSNRSYVSGSLNWVESMDVQSAKTPIIEFIYLLETFHQDLNWFFLASNTFLSKFTYWKWNDWETELLIGEIVTSFLFPHHILLIPDGRFHCEVEGKVREVRQISPSALKNRKRKILPLYRINKTFKQNQPTSLTSPITEGPLKTEQLPFYK